MNRSQTIPLLAVLLVLAACALWAWILQTRAPGTVANIYQNGVCVRSVDLSKVGEPYEFTITDAAGENTVRVEPGRIRITAADCPDKICVNTGWISDSAAPIVCLPHRLVIRLEEGPADGVKPLDGVAG
ncbi:MAG: NusG domain II-containing protein [Clostridia bacterium]|nr:NusG domain II-containing protein [Clostridia bacterium]MCR4906098.1 NusG domain II-containing protein [Clostridiales bacterium]